MQVHVCATTFFHQRGRRFPDFPIVALTSREVIFFISLYCFLLCYGITEYTQRNKIIMLKYWQPLDGALTCDPFELPNLQQRVQDGRYQATHPRFQKCSLCLQTKNNPVSPADVIIITAASWTASLQRVCSGPRTGAEPFVHHGNREQRRPKPYAIKVDAPQPIVVY